MYVYCYGELAAQVAESFATYGKYHKLTKALLIGGERMDEQVRVVDSGVDVLIATPGRLLDLMNQGHIHLDQLDVSSILGVGTSRSHWQAHQKEEKT